MNSDRKPHQGGRRYRLAFLAFAVAVFSCFAGAFFCLVKSPQDKAGAYLTAAAGLADGENALAAAGEAVRLDPSSVEAWQLVTYLLREEGQFHAAQKAAAVVRMLQQNPDPAAPLYAGPAELRLSFLNDRAAAHP